MKPLSLAIIAVTLSTTARSLAHDGYILAAICLLCGVGAVVLWQMNKE